MTVFINNDMKRQWIVLARNKETKFFETNRSAFCIVFVTVVNIKTTLCSCDEVSSVCCRGCTPVTILILAISFLKPYLITRNKNSKVILTLPKMGVFFL